MFFLSCSGFIVSTSKLQTSPPIIPPVSERKLSRLGSVGLVDLGLGYGCLTELTELPGEGIKPILNSQKFRVLWPGRTELT